MAGRGGVPDPGWPTAATRLVALLGWPARHSLSPVIHNAAFAEQGLDLVYLALPVEPADLGGVVDALATVEAVGANVTVPHKQAVMAHCDTLTVEAELVGAVNTLSWTPDGLLGDNTDAAGLASSLADDVGLGVGERAVVLGTGGAARAVAVALGRLGSEVTFVGRRAEAVEAVLEVAVTAGAQADGVVLEQSAWVEAALAGARLVVNATPLGMAGEELPGPFQRLTSGQVAYDLVYSPPETPFLLAARDAGATTHHGLGMLIAQAAASYRAWTGRDAPSATMSAAALAALTSARPSEPGRT